MLLGVTHQISGTSWAGAKGLQYVGSIGPLRLSASLQRNFERIGKVLSRQFHLKGLFGVDAIIADGIAWPVEVNPRYTASVEVLERSLGIHAVRLHVEACEHSRLPAYIGSATSTIAGKAILYAKQPILIGASFGEFVRVYNRESEWPAVADIPAIGTAIPQGRPIVTLLTSSNSVAETEAKLQELALVAEQFLYGSC